MQHKKIEVTNYKRSRNLILIYFTDKMNESLSLNL